MLLVKLPVTSRLLVVKLLGSQMLTSDFFQLREAEIDAPNPSIV